MNHGGAAFFAHLRTPIQFSQSDGQTGKWDILFQSTRIAGIRYQIQRNLNILVFTVYLVPGQVDDEILEKNNAFMADVLEICAEFGDIPIITTGDFQFPPVALQSIAQAFTDGKWLDSLTTFQGDKSMERPYILQIFE